MKHEDLPPHLRPRDAYRLPLEELPLEMPDSDVPPPLPPRERNDRDVDPFLRRALNRDR